MVRLGAYSRTLEMRYLLLLLPLFLATAFAAKRNIILFVADDQSPDIGCYGNAAMHTPNFDALAADGTRFTHAFATTASCSASRSVILSGLHNHANGQYGHTHAFHKFSSYGHVRSLPVMLSEGGYQTMSIGKYHVAPERVYHFDDYVRANPRNPLEMANKVDGWLEEADGDAPFFIYFCTSDPHRGGGRVDESEFASDLFGNMKNGASHEGVTERFYTPEEVTVPDFLPDTKESREELAQYAQSVSRIDFGFGRLVEILKARGLYEDTLIAITADHGMAFAGAKTTVYEGGLRVPFLVRDPYAKTRGVVCDAMISHIDITPSLLDFAGVEYTAKPGTGEVFENMGKLQKNLHGRSWLPLLETSKTKGWDEIGASHTFHEIQMYYPMRVFRDRQYKIIWNIAHGQPYPFASDLWASSTWQAQLARGEYAPYGKMTVKSYVHRPPFELYDIVNDPAEGSNLALDPDHKQRLETYKGKLKAMQKKTNDPWIMKWRYE